MALVAVTWNRTAVPFVNPVTTRLVAVAAAGRRAPTWTLAAFTTRTVYPVMAEPPFTLGMDVAGVVDAVGEGAEATVGQRVVGIADRSLVTTGQPHAIASASGLPNPSISEGWHKATAPP